jgi:adenylate cyclase
MNPAARPPLLAAAVGAGLARVEQEQAALAAQVRFGPFFTPELARELQKNPRLLASQERAVTLLFGDIRGFSRLAERLGPRPPPGLPTRPHFP